MGSWPSGISAITLFVEDLAATKQFYQEVFGLPVHCEDDASTVFDFGNTLINLLKVEEAPGSSRRPRSLVPTPDPASSSRSTSTTWTRCALSSPDKASSS